jgi:hypothetical protein
LDIIVPFGAFITFVIPLVALLTMPMMWHGRIPLEFQCTLKTTPFQSCLFLE